MAILWPEPAATRKLFPTCFLKRLGMERPAYGPPLPGAGGNQDGVSNFFPSGSDWKGSPLARLWPELAVTRTLFPTLFSSGSNCKGLPLAGAGGDQDVVSNVFLQRLRMEAGSSQDVSLFCSPAAGVGRPFKRNSAS